eukprot:scaffold10998_cov112-Isochrysis_galbana.AAC.1
MEHIHIKPRPGVRAYSVRVRARVPCPRRAAAPPCPVCARATCVTLGLLCDRDEARDALSARWS